MKIKQFELMNDTELHFNELTSTFSDILKSNSFIMGEHLKCFEQNFAKYCQATYCIGVGNGLDALEISLRALGIEHGDEVILPTHTFIATALAVSRVGAKPVFVDSCPQTFLIDASKIESVVTKKTKVILPVHLYGLVSEMDLICELSKKLGLYIVEDCAQSQGSEYKGRRSGSIGNLAGTSFYPTKNLGAFGDAGAITTSDSKLAKKCKLFRNYGQTEKYVHDAVGCNSRLDELQAAFLNIKLKTLDLKNEQRRKLSQRYKARLSDLKQIQFQFIPEYCQPVFHQFVIKTKNRQDLLTFLSNKGIGCGIHYPTPVHMQKAYSFLNLKKGDFPIAEEISSEILSLPMFPQLSIDDVDYICDAVIDFFT